MYILSDFPKIKDLIKNNLRIVQNTGYLTIIECVRLLLPFVALPYIVHTVGMERYGIVAFAHTVINYFFIFINFGLNISSVKEVALLRDNKTALHSLVSSVLAVKLFLLILSFFILMLCIALVPVLAEHKTIMFYSFLICFYELLFPIWYFQGIEKMKYITLVSSSSIILYTLSVFIFVTKQSDYELVALLQSLSSIIAGLIAFFCLIRIERVRLSIPPLSQIVSVFKNAIPFFLSRVSVVYNANLAKTISGLFLSMESVAAFDIAQKLSQFVLIPVDMLNQATYPYVARTRNKVFITKYLCLNALLGLLLSLMLFAVAPLLISIFTNENVAEATKILRVLCLFTFSDTITMGLGACTLVAFGYSKPFNDSVIASTLVLSSIYLIIYGLGLFSTGYFAFAIFLSSMFVLAYRMRYCIKYGIFDFKALRNR